MNIPRMFLPVAAGFLLSSTMLVARTVEWFSDTNGVNRNGAGELMDAGFQFQLGVFSGAFQPTASNMHQWADYWTPADSVAYNAVNNFYSGQIAVLNNTTPFTVNAKAWVMGRKVTSTGTETILFRRSGWLWPAPDPMDPIILKWRLNGDPGVEVVVGAVNPGGSPFLMQSLTVRSYDQWRTANLLNEPLDGENDDPDQDRQPNLLEFVFGSDPKIPGPPAVTALTKVNVGGNDYLQISIPRRRDHLAVLKVQVSSDLEIWNDGNSFTEVIADGPLEWIVRDKTPFPHAGGRRFMRLQASLPAAP